MRGWNRPCREQLELAPWQRYALLGLLMIPAASQFAGCGSDDPVEPQAVVDISVSKTVDVAIPDEGDTIVYTVVVANDGPDGATAVQVTDPLPTGVTYQSDSATEGSYTSGTGVWNVGSVANGASETLMLTVTVDAGTGGTTITNTATLTNVAEDDRNSANDTDSADVTPRDPAAVDIAVSKAVNDATPTEGDTITYTVVASNGGPNDATAVQITDLLPTGITFDSDAATQGTYTPGTGVWDVGSIANGASATLTLTVTVDEGTGGTGTITNTAELTQVGETDSDDTNDSASVDITPQNHMLVLNPIRDNTLYESAGGLLSNGVGHWLFAGRTNGDPSTPVDGDLRRCLMKFDFVSLPANAIIESVELTLTVSRLRVPSLVNFVVHRVQADWGEGTSNAGANGGGGALSTTGDATWLHRFYDGSFWDNAGGDFDAFEAATVAVGDVGPYTWSGAGLLSHVNDWIANPSQNFGWVLLGREDVDDTTRRFDSRENPNGNGPKLKITYALP